MDLTTEADRDGVIYVGTAKEVTVSRLDTSKYWNEEEGQAEEGGDSPIEVEKHGATLANPPKSVQSMPMVQKLV